MADDSLQQLNKPKVEIHPEAVVVAKAILRGGNIVIGAGTVIHPQVFEIIPNFVSLTTSPLKLKAGLS